MEQVRLVSSGTEAAMSALRLARGATGRSKIVKFEGCYHGHADALLVKAGSGLATFGHPTSAGVPRRGGAAHAGARVQQPRAARGGLRAARRASIACVMIEPIAGNMNFVRASVPFMTRLRELCTQHGALLVFDEVMTGFRVALGSAQSLYAKLIPGFAPDMSVFGKVIGGGMPLAAFGGKRAVMEQLAPLGPGLPGRHAVGQPGGHGLRPGHAARDPQARLLRGAVGANTQSLVDGLLGAARDGRRADGRRLRRRHVRLLLRRRTAAELPAVMATDKERFNRFFHAHAGVAACTSRRRCTKPASSARRTAPTTSPPPWPPRARALTR